MTYRELAKELGLSSFKLMDIENRGLLKSHGAAALLGKFDEQEVKVIRECCLFSMLGIPDEAAFSMVKGEADLKSTLKKYLDDILADEKNHTQAAIVIQNIRRECTNIDELDPVPFLQHINELKASGGTFYDLNSGRLDERKSFGNDKKQGKTGLFGGLFGSMTGTRLDNDEKRERDIDVYNGRKPDDSPDAGKTGSYDSTGGNADRAGVQSTGFEKDTSDAVHVTGDETGTSNGAQAIGSEHDTSDSTRTTDGEAQTSGNAHNERWSPYTTHGYGDSNMGSGNWHGWSPGYGTYTTKIGPRERVNNGEKTCPYPARRFIARIVDTTIVTLIGNAILKIGFRINTGLSMQTLMYCEIIFWLFELMIEPLLLSTIGTTPGKWIMGIKVRDMKTKGKLEIKQSYTRALKLAWHGFGFMIPIFTLYKRGVSYFRCRMNDTMPWDGGIDVELDDDRQTRIALCVIAVILLNVGDEFIAKQAMLPQNKGDITYEQFRENLVEIMKYTGYTGDILDNYKVTTGSNGFVSSVSISFTEEQSTTDRYNQMYLAFLAFAGASEGSNGIKLMLTSATGKMRAYYNSFEDNYCGVNIKNISDSKIMDENSYSTLYSMLYGSTPSVPAFNQTFTMTRTR
ncbi:MAG: RDD family protein [Lachnospiraceae bacterium]|nr:RDD family protein [Lachnospiraceae bacterium]